MSDIVPLTLIIALFCEAALIAMLVWSIFVPDRRLWPPRQVSWLSQIIVWIPTVAVFGAAIVVGVAEWNVLNWPLWFQWGVGLPLILAGNAVVWPAALGICLNATAAQKQSSRLTASNVGRGTLHHLLQRAGRAICPLACQPLTVNLKTSLAA